VDLADYLPAGAVALGNGPGRRLPRALLWLRLASFAPLAVIVVIMMVRTPPSLATLPLTLVVGLAMAAAVQWKLRKDAIEAVRSLAPGRSVGLAVWAPSSAGNWEFWALSGADLVAPDRSSRSMGQFRFLRAAADKPVRWLDVDGNVRRVRGFVDQSWFQP
jgi:hypothetical protein